MDQCLHTVLQFGCKASIPRIIIEFAVLLCNVSAPVTGWWIVLCKGRCEGHLILLADDCSVHFRLQVAIDGERNGLRLHHRVEWYIFYLGLNLNERLKLHCKTTKLVRPHPFKSKAYLFGMMWAKNLAIANVGHVSCRNKKESSIARQPHGGGEITLWIRESFCATMYQLLVCFIFPPFFQEFKDFPMVSIRDKTSRVREVLFSMEFRTVQCNSLPNSSTTTSSTENSNIYWSIALRICRKLVS